MESYLERLGNVYGGQTENAFQRSNIVKALSEISRKERRRPHTVRSLAQLLKAEFKQRGILIKVRSTTKANKCPAHSTYYVGDIGKGQIFLHYNGNGTIWIRRSL